MFSAAGMIAAVVVLEVISMILGKKQNKDREKNSPFECGFDPKSFGRVSFSVRFFLIGVIFLIFDVEIALLLPLMVLIFNSSAVVWVGLEMMFLLILIFGVFLEWKEGALDWKVLSNNLMKMADLHLENKL
uniref:NADH-ubiquinone oxidoreductase chain 3 n=1 Tax=Oniscus asellus TaxID=96861 RepID=A0A1P8DKE0_ONIAS|nr:NADH dehydrogenase subunit 3 [Oniscus asellus]